MATFWRAEGELSGRAWDLGDLAEPCATQQEAKESARAWLARLTDYERATAVAWVRQWEGDPAGGANTVEKGEVVYLPGNRAQAGTRSRVTPTED